MSGPIPNFPAQMKHLYNLDLSSNHFSGTLPHSLYKLPKLGSIFFYNNSLTGSIPPSYGYFNNQNLPSLLLSHNQLSGRLPNSLGRLNTTVIELSYNKFEGDASMLFGSNKRLQYLDLSRNLFSFDFSKVDFPKKSLTILNLNHNNIYGKIPLAITKVEDFREFNVSYNLLCGQIPQGGYLHTRFDVFSYYHNKCLCGSPLPKCK
jgi:Leucine-rich repeat (LRR) protein